MNIKTLVSLAALVSAGHILAITPKEAGQLKQKLQAVLVKPLMEWTNADANMQNDFATFAKARTEGQKYQAAYEAMLENLAAVQEARAKYEKDLADITKKLDTAKTDLTDKTKEVTQAGEESKKIDLTVEEMTLKYIQANQLFGKAQDQLNAAVKALSESEKTIAANKTVSAQEKSKLEQEVADAKKETGNLVTLTKSAQDTIKAMQDEIAALKTENVTLRDTFQAVKANVDLLIIPAQQAAAHNTPKEYPKTVLTTLQEIQKAINPIVVPAQPVKTKKAPKK